MAQRICQTRSDDIDNARCLQRTFDKLARAEANALVAERNKGVDAGAIVSTASALAWAYDKVMTGLEKHQNETAELWPLF